MIKAFELYEELQYMRDFSNPDARTRRLLDKLAKYRESESKN
jgi:hypothetical protein